MKKVLIAGAGFIGILLAIVIFVPGKQASNPQPSYSQLSIGNKVTITVEIAQTPAEQAQGLSGRTSLASDHGMLFVFANPGIYSFWMKDMRIPLDFLWIDSQNTIVDIHENIPATDPSTSLNQLPLYHAKTTIAQVLEVNAGFINKHQIKMGDTVTLKEK